VTPPGCLPGPLLVPASAAAFVMAASAAASGAEAFAAAAAAAGAAAAPTAVAAAYPAGWSCLVEVGCALRSQAGKGVVAWAEQVWCVLQHH
jgi:hypothetical protein